MTEDTDTTDSSSRRLSAVRNALEKIVHIAAKGYDIGIVNLNIAFDLAPSPPGRHVPNSARTCTLVRPIRIRCTKVLRPSGRLAEADLSPVQERRQHIECVVVAVDTLARDRDLEEPEDDGVTPCCERILSVRMCRTPCWSNRSVEPADVEKSTSLPPLMRLSSVYTRKYAFTVQIPRQA